MKKLLVVLFCVILCVTILASCQSTHTESDADEHTYEYIQYEYGHFKQYTCGCPSPEILGEHIDADKNDICDVCKYEYVFVFKLAADAVGYELDRVGPGYKGGDVVIPSEYRGLPVVEIGYSAFTSNYKLTSVIIPDTVALINGDAFKNQTSLTSVNVGNGVITIGVSAFEGCTSLKTVVISDATQYIFAHAFDGCTSLENITLGKNVREITGSVFEECTSLKTIAIPASIENMGAWVFYGNNMSDIYFGVSAPGENWDGKWAEGLNSDVKMHWIEPENTDKDIIPPLKLTTTIYELPREYNEYLLFEKYDCFWMNGYYLIDNSEDCFSFLSDIGLTYEESIDDIFEDKVILCYLRAVSGNEDFIPVEYFYYEDTNKIDYKTIYQPAPGSGFASVLVCWCVDFVEVPKTLDLI